MTRLCTAPSIPLLLSLVVLHITCGNDAPTAPSIPPPAATALRISGQTAFTSLGQTSQLTSEAVLATGATENVTSRTAWSSGDQSVAAVSASGVLTALGFGATEVFAQYQSQSASLDVRILPGGTFILSGSVTEAVDLPIYGAVVQVAGGQVNGSRSTTTNVNGSYWFNGVSGSITVSATHAGYVERASAVDLSEDRTVDLELTPTTPPANLAGTYQLTFTASGTCSASLPPEVRARTYTATINQQGSALEVTLSGAQFVSSDARHPSDLSNHFPARVSGNSITFDLYHDAYYGGGYTIAEQIGQQHLGLFGTAVGKRSGNTIAGALNGSFDFFIGSLLAGHPTSACPAADHQFSFVR